MMIYGQNSEKIIIFDQFTNIFINFGFIMIALVFIFLGHVNNIYFLLMFIFSLIICHLSDVLIKIQTVANAPNIKIIYYLPLISFLLWYVASYAIVINIIIVYAIFAPLLSCIVTIGYGAILTIYLSVIINIPNHYFIPSGYHKRY